MDQQEQPQGESFSGGPGGPGAPGNPFTEALKRAREISASMQQMQPNGGAAEEGEPNLKRPYDDSGMGDQPAKKPMIESAGGAPPPVAGGPGQIDFATAAAQAQAKAQAFMAQASAAMPNSEEMMVPNRMVGVIIGRGGDTINRLQNDSGARIQCAPPDPNNPNSAERAVTLTGTPEAIQSARAMIHGLVEQGPPDQQGPAPGGLMPQPGMAPGMVGGMGGGMGGGVGGPPPMGGAGMAGSMPGGMGGPGGQMPPGGEVYEQLIPQPKVGLIIGKGGETIKRLQEQAGCRMQMVQDGQYMNAPQRLLRIQGAPSAIEAAKSLVNELIGGVDFVAPGNHTVEMQVPTNLVGMVIGRGGESIKRIQAETGVRIQFQQHEQSMSRPGMRTANLVGPPEGIPQAQKMVVEILERGADGQGGAGAGAGRPPPMGGHQIEFPVPAGRCGLVIGRGGETIRALQTQSGAHIQLNRNAPCGPDEKVFTIRGTREQVAHAQELIREKCGDMPPGGSGPSGYNQPGMQQGGMAAHGMYPQQGQPMQQPYATYPMQQQQQQGYPQAGGAMPSDMQAQQAQAAWAAYYQQYYAQMAAAAGNPAAAQMGQAGQPGAPAAGAPGAAQQATSQAGAAGGQDLQAQWAEFYRQYGYSYPGQQSSR